MPDWLVFGSRGIKKIESNAKKLAVGLLAKAHAHLIIGALLSAILGATFASPFPTQALETQFTSSYLDNDQTLITNSRFTSREQSEIEEIPFETKTVKDDRLNWGETQITQEGKNGSKTTTYLINYFEGEIFDKEVLRTEIVEPQNETVTVGTRQIGGTIDSPDGLLKYKGKLKVWATSYDPFCFGCNETTAIGLKAGYGVIAVDPSVIPLRSRVFVPGYGLAIAGDTGGAVRGNKIDLGFDNVENGWWSSRYTDVYILE